MAQNETNQFIEVFGSAIINVEPDIAQISFTASRVAERPNGAFSQVQQATKSIQEFLNQAAVKDVRASRLRLQHEFNHRDQRYIGYKASISFSLIVHNLERIEELLTGVVEAGANQIDSNNFLTSRLKEIRAEARREAVAAAREKALLYCEAAGASLGKILTIIDVNPDTLRSYEGHGGGRGEMFSETEDPSKLFSPSSIVVRAAVRLTYSLSVS
jgi:uncharacterized protein YggE